MTFVNRVRWWLSQRIGLSSALAPRRRRCQPGSKDIPSICSSEAVTEEKLHSNGATELRHEWVDAIPWSQVVANDSCHRTLWRHYENVDWGYSFWVSYLAVASSPQDPVNRIDWDPNFVLFVQDSRDRWSTSMSDSEECWSTPKSTLWGVLVSVVDVVIDDPVAPSKFGGR